MGEYLIENFSFFEVIVYYLRLITFQVGNHVGIMGVFRSIVKLQDPESILPVQCFDQLKFAVFFGVVEISFHSIPQPGKGL